MIFTPETRLAALLGWPIAQSRSPKLHAHWLALHGIDGAYIPFAIRPEDFEAVFRALPKLGFRGCNVTLPFKERAAALVDALDPLARRVGAVNTVVFGPEGAIGSNSDAPGFLANLRAQAPGWSAAAGPAVVLGAGGAARAIVAALLDAGVGSVRVLNRTLERGAALADALGGGAEAMAWDEYADAVRDAALLVNTTSLGMAGQPPLEVDLDELPDHAVVADIVYKPLETDLLADTRARGLVAVEGLGMLLHQAVPGFEAWFGPRPEVTEAARAAALA